VADFQAAGRELNHAVTEAIASGRLVRATAKRANEALIQVERNWCTSQGIPGRPWFKHSLYGARYTYAHLELPGLTEAAEAGDWPRASEQAKIIEDALANNTALLRQAKLTLDSAWKEEK
jgi:N-acetylated-alpha-linked acidic dipeptidase